MKKLLKISVFLLVVGLAMGLTGCPDEEDDDPNGPSLSNVDYTNHQPGSIRVRNNTNIDLVAFKGRPDIARLLGGVPANATNHGLTRDGFTESADFALTLVTETAYNAAMAAGGNQALANVQIFNVVYAFYNHTGTNNNVFQINAQSGGIGRLVLENPTAWNVEIRQSAYNGVTIGFIGPFTSTQTLNMEPGQYTLYPVLRRFNPLLGEIIDVQPVFPDGVIAGTPLFRNILISGAATPPWNFRSVAQDATINMVSGGAFVRVVNNSDEAIEFVSGGTVQQTSMGFTWLAAGASMVFQIHFPRNPDGSFSYTHTANFGVRVPGVGTPGGTVPSRTLEIDWLYQILVTGTNASNITVSVLTEVQKMDIENLFSSGVN